MKTSTEVKIGINGEKIRKLSRYITIRLKILPSFGIMKLATDHRFGKESFTNLIASFEVRPSLQVFYLVFSSRYWVLNTNLTPSHITGITK
jgi:hypothetical protein